MSTTEQKPTPGPMSPKQARLFREVYYANAEHPYAPYLVDGPHRGKVAAEMVAAGWLTDEGAVGSPFPLGHAHRITKAGIDAHNAAIAKAEVRS